MDAPGRPATAPGHVQNEARAFLIYGDNILECERALALVADAVPGDAEAQIKWMPGPLYAPKYDVVVGDRTVVQAQLFPGYGRWGYDVREGFRSRGAPLREASDAVIVLAPTPDGDGSLEPILALEFCGALPAGNNAWQRMGRGLAAGLAGVPYLYFAELGGAELDADRTAKAGRLPNPLIPFAYLSHGQTSGSVSIPVFSPSPTVDSDTRVLFQDVFDSGEAKEVVRAILFGGDPSKPISILEDKAATVVAALAASRRRNDSLTSDEWVQLAEERTGAAKASWLTTRKLGWGKKASIPTLTRTFRSLVDAATRDGAVAVGSSSVPICLLGAEGRGHLAASLESIYGTRLGADLPRWLRSSRKPLVIVWICGFKPRGDDSRPDRGLLPMAHMVFGGSDVDYLSVIYGPAPAASWGRLMTDAPGLAMANGLWETVIGLSDAVLADSSTATALPQIGIVLGARHVRGAAAMVAHSSVPPFGEHDIDSVLHTLFSNTPHMYESMCNPPGGDWSGIKYREHAGAPAHRWSSLPRVTAADEKRPDHVAVVFGLSPVLVAIESKERGSSLERSIGPRLAKYVTSLLTWAPNGVDATGRGSWSSYSGGPIRPIPSVITGAAVPYTGETKLADLLDYGTLDFAIGCEFLPDVERVIVHVVARPSGALICDVLPLLTDHFAGHVVVEVHRLPDGV